MAEETEAQPMPRSDHNMLTDLWHEHRTPLMIAIAAGTMLLTAVLVFRKNASSNASSSTTPASGTTVLGSTGVPTASTSDSVSAYDSLTQYMQAILQQLQQVGSSGSGSGSASSGTGSSGTTSTLSPGRLPGKVPGAVQPGGGAPSAGTPAPAPAPAPPWYNRFLQTRNGAQSWYQVTTPTTVKQLAADFNLAHGWTDIAYNPSNSSLLHQSYLSKGGNTLAPGTFVWIPRTQILPGPAPQLSSQLTPSPVGS